MTGESYTIQRPIPANNSELDEKWEYIKEGLDHVMSGSAAPMSMVSYSGIRTVLFNGATGGFNHRGAGKKEDVDQEDASSLSPGGQLYVHVREYLKTSLSSIAETGSALKGVDRLRFYETEWLSYKKRTSAMNRLLNALNRQYIAAAKNEGMNVYPIDILALVQWKTYIFLDFWDDEGSDPRRRELTDSLINLVTQFRDDSRGHSSAAGDLHTMKTMIDSLVVLDAVNPRPKPLPESASSAIDTRKTRSKKKYPTIRLYEETFHTPFLAASEAYFAQEVQDHPFTPSNTSQASEYLHVAYDRFRTENELASYYHPLTLQPLLTKFDDIYIQNLLPNLKDAFVPLVREDRVDDLQRLYILLARAPESLQTVREGFAGYIKEVASEALRNLVSSLPSPKTYAGALLGIHSRFTQLSYASFQNDRGFEEIFQNTFREIVNRNEATNFDPRKSAEAIVECVIQLGGSEDGQGMDVDGAEEEYRKLMLLVAYLEEKDVVRRIPGYC